MTLKDYYVQNVRYPAAVPSSVISCLLTQGHTQESTLHEIFRMPGGYRKYGLAVA
jgi:hypothetical protein